MVAEETPAPLVLTRRLPAPAGLAGVPGVAGAPRASQGAGTAGEELKLRLSADERTRLRGLRHSLCGRPLLLQLPRGEALQPGEGLASAAGDALVVVEAAPEPLLLVRAGDATTLLRAAYHLGNRHVALEVRGQELRLLDDPVLAELLQHLGLQLERRSLPFQPEAGAYASPAGHSHSHSHNHSSGHSHGQGEEHHPIAGQGASPGETP